MKKTLCILLFLFGFYAIGIAQGVIPVEGILFGRPIQTKVDHPLAKLMLTNPNDSAVVELFSEYRHRKLSTETLSEITQRYSADVSTLFFAERIYEQEKNRIAQDFYLTLIDSLTGRDISKYFSFLKDYFIVFVPGFRYQMVDNGGNFLNQRLLLDSAGIPYEMVDIDEIGLVDNNAKIVANRLQELSRLHNNIIVISVSKGGLETAIALDMLPQDQTSVKGWINVGGTLKGTPMADRWLPPLMRFWMRCGLFFIGKNDVKLKPLLRDLSYKRCKEAYKDLKIPSNVTTISLVAVPLGDRPERSGIFPVPNDGFSPLVDSTVEDGIVVLEMAVNHFFRDIDLDVRMLILLQHIVNLKNKEHTIL